MRISRGDIRRCDEAVGDRHAGLPAGTLWRDVPEEFVCPDCTVRVKEDFVEEGRG